MDIISSTQNQRVRYVKSLQSKARLRRSDRKLVLEGDRLIADALLRGGAPDLALYSPEHANYDLIAQLQNGRCTLLPVSAAVLSYVSDTQQTPGILAVFHIPTPPLPQDAKRVLILDAIREPGNLGTVLRTAAAAGVDLTILAPGGVDPYNSKAVRAGMGAHFRLPVVEAAWNEITGYCAGLKILAASADAELSYTAVNWRDGWALIVGNEAHGISRRAQQLAQHTVAIPMSHATESLNVAGAVAVMLFEAQRQRISSTL